MEKPGKRQAVVVSSLNDVFRGTGAGSNAFNATQFTKYMDELARQPALKKALYNELPPGARRSLDNLYKISKGISKAQGKKVPTGRILTLFKGDSSNLITKLIGTASQAIAAKTTGGVSGVLGGMVIKDMLSQTSDVSKAASNVLSNAEFQNLMRVAAREGYQEGAEVSNILRNAEKAFQKSQAYKRWAAALDPEAQAQLATLGMLGYLTNEEEK